MFLFVGSLWGQDYLFLPNSPFDDEVIYHSAYIVGYCEQYEQARWIAYELRRDELSGVQKRTNNFREDPDVSTGSAIPADYYMSGYDRGHLAPAADMKFSEIAMSESFFMSNISPQKPKFNQGVWRKLENEVRRIVKHENSIFIVTGPIFTGSSEHLGDNRVTVPKYFYKVLLDASEPDVKGIGFILPNEPSSQSIYSYAVPIDEVELKTGIDFFPALPDALEDSLEATVNINAWRNH